MSLSAKERRKDIIYKSRQYPLELRLLQFFVFSQEAWAVFNLIASAIFKMPTPMIRMCLGVSLFLPVYWTIGYYSGKEKYFVNIYSVIYLLTMPGVWFYLGGNETSANILFVCELVVFAMCLKGKRQAVFIVLSMVSSSMLSAMQAALPGFSPVVLTIPQKAIASRNVGLSTSLLIAALLIKQKKEYAKERDAAISSEKELEKSNQLQKNFLANMSHEIRSPLGIVLGFNDLIAESNNLDSIHEYSANITKAGKTLHTVINDILDYSKIESGKLDIIDVDYSYSELITEVKNDIGLKCAEKGLKFTIDSDSAIPAYLFGDNIRIKQCLLNLLSNAVKYTDQGEVSLKVGLEEGAREGYCNLRFCVSDTGRGMRPETIPNLFNAFQRLDEGQNRGIEGTGLGLAITKNLLDEMHGRIDVSSIYGKGSTFDMHIEQKISDKVNEAENISAENIDISGLKILAIDDTKMNLSLISKLLVKQGVIVNTIDNGADGIKDCETNKYDVILLDHMMPEMDGIEVFKSIRRGEGANKNTPIIMLTANAMAGASKEYTDLGFDGYVSKPISPKELKEVIYQTIKKSI